MKHTKFVKLKLTEAVNKFPQIRCRYKYDSFSVIHFVEFSPARFFNKDDSFTKWRHDFFFEFIDLYPDENLCNYGKGDKDIKFIEKYMPQTCICDIKGSLYEEPVLVSKTF